MTDTTDAAAAKVAAAAAAVQGQMLALVAAAAPYREQPTPYAARELARALLADPDNDRGALATAAAILAVTADRGDCGTPDGMLLMPALLVVRALMFAEETPCAAPTTCPGDCSRCTVLAGLREWTGLSGVTGEALG